MLYRATQAGDGGFCCTRCGRRGLNLASLGAAPALVVATRALVSASHHSAQPGERAVSNETRQGQKSTRAAGVRLVALGSWWTESRRAWLTTPRHAAESSTLAFIVFCFLEAKKKEEEKGDEMLIRRIPAPRVLKNTTTDHSVQKQVSTGLLFAVEQAGVILLCPTPKQLHKFMNSSSLFFLGRGRGEGACASPIHPVPQWHSLPLCPQRSFQERLCAEARSLKKQKCVSYCKILSYPPSEYAPESWFACTSCTCVCKRDTSVVLLGKLGFEFPYFLFETAH